MDDELVAAVEDQHNQFQQGSSGVEPENESTGWITVVQVAFVNRMGHGVQGIILAHAVLASRSVNAPIHEARRY